MPTHLSHSRVFSLLVLLGAFALGAAALTPSYAFAQQSYDPVEDLRQALRLEDVRQINDFIIEFREKNLDAKIKNLRTISDLRRALTLDEWKEDLNQGRNEVLRKIDEAKRKEVGDKLHKLVKAAVASPDPNTRLAVANMISEMGPTVRATDLGDRNGYARSLTKEVLQLTNDSDMAVRQEAYRALGTINAPSKTAADVFAKTLKNPGEPIGLRRLSGSGLLQMVKVSNQLKRTGRGSARVLTTDDEVQKTAEDVAAASGNGLEDADSYVRSYCLDAIQTAASSLIDLAFEPFARKDFPPEGRKLTEEERARVVANYNTVRGEYKKLNPLASALSKQVPAVSANLVNGDAGVRQSALAAIDYIASGRLKLKKRIESVPFVKQEKLPVEPIGWEDPLEGFWGQGLQNALSLINDPEPRVRGGVAVLLGMLEDKGIPGIPTLIKGMEDSNRFVRWESARSIGMIAPAQSQAAVPNLVRMLNESDLNVREAAANTLQLMGIHARVAAPAVAQALLEGDVESRVYMMQILLSVPPQDAQVAVPQLIQILTHPDARVRRASAETLGRLGSFARPAVPALRRLIGDEDAEVRTAASDAILSALMD